MDYYKSTEIYESTENYYDNIKSNTTVERLDGIYTIIMNAFKFGMNDIIYKSIIDWRWIDTLCIFSCDDKLIKILKRAKKHKDFIAYKNYSEGKEHNFNVYGNIRDICEIHDKFNIIDLFEPDV